MKALTFLKTLFFFFLFLFLIGCLQEPKESEMQSPDKHELSSEPKQETAVVIDSVVTDSSTVYILTDPK